MSQSVTESGPVGSPVVLLQFRPAWDIQAYMRFSGITYYVENVSYPEFDSTGELPQLQHGKVCVGWRKAVKYLKSLRGDKEEGLSEPERADVVAYTAMCQGPLRDAVLFYQWMDHKRYESTTRRLLRTAMQFPLSWFVPTALRKRYAVYLEYAGWADEISVKREAAACYKALAAKLGDKSFLFGETPTSADALLFGHLSSAVQEPLLDLLNKHPTLLAFHARVLAQFFPEDLKESGVGYLATHGLNVFERHEKALHTEGLISKGKKGPGGSKGDPDTNEGLWRWAVLSVGAIALGFAVISSRKRS